MVGAVHADHRFGADGFDEFAARGRPEEPALPGGRPRQDRAAHGGGGRHAGMPQDRVGDAMPRGDQRDVVARHRACLAHPGIGGVGVGDHPWVEDATGEDTAPPQRGQQAGADGVAGESGDGLEHGTPVHPDSTLGENGVGVNDERGGSEGSRPVRPMLGCDTGRRRPRGDRPCGWRNKHPPVDEYARAARKVASNPEESWDAADHGRLERAPVTATIAGVVRPAPAAAGRRGVRAAGPATRRPQGRAPCRRS